MARAKGRANGEGSPFRDKHGQWWAQITLPSGRPKRARAKSQREAIEKIKALKAELDQGVNLAKQQPTLVEWWGIWLDKYARNLKPNIREDYRGVGSRYVEPASIGKRKVKQLTPAEIQDWADELSTRVSAQTVHNAHARLHKALAVAVTRHYRLDNPADHTELPEIRPRPIEPLNYAQACKLLEVVMHHRWAVLYRLAINLGLRESELLGLTWSAVDLEKGTIRIYRQLRRVPKPSGEGKEFVLQTTKTASSDRVLDLDDGLVRALRILRRLQDEERALLGAKWKERWGLLFVSETGGPIHMSNLRGHFKGLLKEAGLPDIRFHDLRHTCASLLLDAGVPLVTVSKILGHSSPAVTAKIYAHALDESKAVAIAALSRRLQEAT